MVAKILAFDLPKVLEYAQMFPDTIGVYLLERQEIVANMFTLAIWIVDDSFAEKYSRAEENWIEFSRSRSTNVYPQIT